MHSSPIGDTQSILPTLINRHDYLKAVSHTPTPSTVSRKILHQEESGDDKGSSNADRAVGARIVAGLDRRSSWHSISRGRGATWNHRGSNINYRS